MAAEILATLLLLLALAFVSIALRRRVLQRRYGTVELSLRLKPEARGRGWVLGIGRFVEDDLQWYRVFSLAPRPRRTFSRRDLVVVGQRPPQGPETYALLQGAVVMECRTPAGPVQMGMDPSTVTGFLAWLEARPPGATLPPG
ncbi:MAG TPA: DUF2550 domain-containing protein [Mycobacteriales bacterium]|nr:DUF2550 domain-containing protein [Mycobacteriales bacterium]